MSKPIGILVTTDAKVGGWEDVQDVRDERDAELAEAEAKAASDPKRSVKLADDAQKQHDAAIEKERSTSGWLVIDTDDGHTIGFVAGGTLGDLHALYDATAAEAVLHVAAGEFKRLGDGG